MVCLIVLVVAGSGGGNLIFGLEMSMRISQFHKCTFAGKQISQRGTTNL